MKEFRLKLVPMYVDEGTKHLLNKLDRKFKGMSLEDISNYMYKNLIIIYNEKMLDFMGTDSTIWYTDESICIIDDYKNMDNVFLKLDFDASNEIKRVLIRGSRFRTDYEIVDISNINFTSKYVINIVSRRLSLWEIIKNVFFSKR